MAATTVTKAACLPDSASGARFWSLDTPGMDGSFPACLQDRTSTTNRSFCLLRSLGHRRCGQAS